LPPDSPTNRAKLADDSPPGHTRDATIRTTHLKAPNYRQRKKQREEAKRKANEEKNQRKGRVPRPEPQLPSG